jgi:alpha-beta hydrolase superfamily lysophospholipase
MELLLNALDLMLRGFALLVIQLRGRGASQPPLGSVHNRHYHFQIA